MLPRQLRLFSANPPPRARRRVDRNSLARDATGFFFFLPALKFSVDAAAPLYSQEITALRLKVKEPRSEEEEEEECESIFQVDISQKQQQQQEKK